MDCIGSFHDSFCQPCLLHANIAGGEDEFGDLEAFVVELQCWHLHQKHVKMRHV